MKFGGNANSAAASFIDAKKVAVCFFVYMTTAELTGVIVVAMLLMEVQNILLGQIGVLIVWFVAILRLHCLFAKQSLSGWIITLSSDKRDEVARLLQNHKTKLW